jgi:hypothetical protein
MGTIPRSVLVSILPASKTPSARVWLKKGDCADRPCNLQGGGRVSGLRHFPKQAQIMRVSQRCNCWASPTLQLLKRLESKGRLLNDPHRHHPPPRRGRRHAPIGSTPTSRSPTRRASGRFGLMRALRTGSAPQVDPARATARSFCGSSRWRRAKQGNKHTATGAN